LSKANKLIESQVKTILYVYFYDIKKETLINIHVERSRRASAYQATKIEGKNSIDWSFPEPGKGFNLMYKAIHTYILPITYMYTNREKKICNQRFKTLKKI